MPEANADKLWVEATDLMLLMRHVHALGYQPDGCTWQLSKQRGDRAIRGMGSKKFAEADQEQDSLGYGEVKIETTATYRCLKEMS